MLLGGSKQRSYTPDMARFEGGDGSAESADFLEGYDGREWSAMWKSVPVKIAAAGVLALALAAIGGF